VDTAGSIGAPVIGVSAMMYTTAKNIPLIRKLLQERELEKRIALAVGGAIFKLHPELAYEAGGDGTAATALDAPELFESLRLKVFHNQMGMNL
ncbi:MAG: hypothetical protein SNJ78_00280, partial [Spirochaetales bacterium]